MTHVSQKKTSLVFDLFFVLFVDSHSSTVSIDDGREWVRREKETGKLSIFFFADSVDGSMCRCLFLSLHFSFLRTSKKAKYNIFFSSYKACHKQTFYSFFYFYFRKKFFIHIYHFSHFLFSFIHISIPVVYSQTIKHITIV